MTADGISPRGWVALLAGTAAVAYGVAFLVWWVTTPVEDAPGGALLGSQSLVVSLVVWALLHRHCKTGGRAALLAAQCTVSLVVIWSFVGGFSLAFGVMPAALLLLVSTLYTPSGSLHTSG